MNALSLPDYSVPRRKTGTFICPVCGKVKPHVGRCPHCGQLPSFGSRRSGVARNPILDYTGGRYEHI